MQGGAFEDLRARVASTRVVAHDLAGYAIGGVSVGEDRERCARRSRPAAPLLPEDRPRYLMGVGTPRDLFDAIARGVDLFDCVTPTRHGAQPPGLHEPRAAQPAQRALRATTARPLDPDCDCPACARYSPRLPAAPVHERTRCSGAMLLTLAQPALLPPLMERMRAAIEADTFEAFSSSVLDRMSRRLTAAQYRAED